MTPFKLPKTMSKLYYEALRDSGFMFEFYPQFTGNYKKDMITLKKLYKKENESE